MHFSHFTHTHIHNDTRILSLFLSHVSNRTSFFTDEILESSLTAFSIAHRTNLDRYCLGLLVSIANHSSSGHRTLGALLRAGHSAIAVRISNDTNGPSQTANTCVTLGNHSGNYPTFYPLDTLEYGHSFLAGNLFHTLDGCDSSCLCLCSGSSRSHGY